MCVGCTTEAALRFFLERVPEFGGSLGRYEQVGTR
jgi:hypothetical protein